MKKYSGKGIAARKSMTGRRLVLLALFVLGVLGAVLIPLYLLRSGMMGGSPSDSYSQYAALAPGSAVKVVCELTVSPANGLVWGIFLEKNNDGSYTRTSHIIRVRYTGTPPVVMGSSQDIHRGTVVQVSGHAGNDGSVIADQVVILTGYIKIH